MAIMTWDEHRERYAALCLERKGLTVREYAEAHGINVNSARRELKGIGNTTKRDHKSGRSGDQNSDHMGDQPRDHGKKNPKDKKRKTPAARTSKGVVGTRREISAIEAPRNDHDHRNDKMIISPAPNGVDDSNLIHVPLPRGGRRFARNNEYTIIHGRYARPREQDIDDVLAEMADPNFFDTLDARLIAKTYAHLNLIERARNRSMDRLDDDADALEGGKTEEEGGGGLHPDHKILQMLLNASAGIGETAKSIAHMRTNMLKTSRDEEVHHSKMEVLNTVALAYEMQKANSDTSYADMAAFIESCGGKVPSHIMAMARIEANKPPELDDSKGEVSQEQLDREARTYREMQAGKEDFLAERRALVASIVDNHGYGDIDAEGNGREGEFIGVDFEEDEEFDEEATRDFYGEDDEE